MKEHSQAVDNCGVLLPGERARHMTKLSVFIKEVNDSLDKHFNRWVRPVLLPAAMLSEEPLARVVGAATLGQDFPSFDTTATVSNQLSLIGFIYFRSAAHKRRICLVLFNKFLRERLGHDIVCTQEANAAAQLIVDKVNLQSFDYEGDNGAIRLHLHETYLPLPSQTQFVESGVKEAKNVSSTDRSEELHAALAIIRSASPLGKSKLDDDTSYNSSKILALIRSAHNRSEPHEGWKRNQIDNAYDARFNTILHSITHGHYKEERLEAKKTKVDEQGPVYKKQNVTQTTHVQQHKMSAMTGLMPHGKLFSKGNGHMDDLMTELIHRGVALEDV